MQFEAENILWTSCVIHNLIPTHKLFLQKAGIEGNQ